MAAPTPLGIVTLTSGGGTITVPAGATGAVAFWGEYGVFSGMTTFSSSFGTANTSYRHQTPSIGGTHNGTGLWAFDVTATGSQTFTPTWSNTPIQGPALSIAFFKDLDANWKDSARFATNHNQYSTASGSVTAETDAYILVFETQDGGSAPSVPSGRTLVQNRSENSIGGVFYYVNSPTAGSNTITSGNSNFPGIAIASIKGASGGGATNYTLTCDAGSYSLTGVAALLRRGYTLAANVGSYALGGQDAILRRGYSVAADVGSYSQAGQDVALRRGYSLVCDVGSYSLTGYDATLTYSAGSTAYTLSCDSGSYALTGEDASLVYTPGAANYTLSCDVGSYSLSGGDATTSLGRRLNADTGSYSLSGQTASLLYGRRLVADAGSYALTGLDATLTAVISGSIAYSLSCETGTYALTGIDASLTFVEVDDVVLLGGGPGLPRKKKRVVRTELDKDSYLYRLLSPEVREQIEPEVAEVIEAKAVEVVEQKAKPSPKAVRVALADEGIAYRQAYKEIYLELIGEIRRAQADEEEEEEAIAMALLL